MSQEKPKRSFQKMLDHFIEQKRQEKVRLGFKDYYEYIQTVRNDGFKIEVDERLLEEETRAKVGRFTAHRNQPHFAGDEYHGHCDVGRGSKLAWTVSWK